MFSQTSDFSKTTKTPLMFSRERKVQKISPRHQSKRLVPCGVRGRNTEDLIKELDLKTANYQRKRYVVMKFIHHENHIVFNEIGKGRRMKEIIAGVEVVIAMIA